MIRLDIQMFAKSATYARKYRKSQAIRKMDEELKQRDEEEKKTGKKKSALGEPVSAVSAHARYQVFVYENGESSPYTDKEGKPVFRTGAQITEKMIYNKNRNGWESKAQIKARKDGLAKIRKYIIRPVR